LTLLLLGAMGCTRGEARSDAVAKTSSTASPALGSSRTPAPTLGSSSAATPTPGIVMLRTAGRSRADFAVSAVRCFATSHDLAIRMIADCPNFTPDMTTRPGEPDEAKLERACPSYKLVAVGFSERPDRPGSYADVRSLAVVVSGASGLITSIGRQKPGKGIVFTKLNSELAEGHLDVEDQEGNAVLAPFSCAIASDKP
jgi:hypothetical protein